MSSAETVLFALFPVCLLATSLTIFCTRKKDDKKNGDKKEPSKSADTAKTATETSTAKLPLSKGGVKSDQINTGEKAPHDAQRKSTATQLVTARGKVSEMKSVKNDISVDATQMSKKDSDRLVLSERRATFVGNIDAIIAKRPKNYVDNCINSEIEEVTADPPTEPNRHAGLVVEFLLYHINDIQSLEEEISM